MKKILFLIVIGLINFNIWAQNVKYEQNIIGVKNTWHYLILSDSVLVNCENNFSDLRIYDITSDTMQMPYFIEKQKQVLSQNIYYFDVLNKSKKGITYFYTLKQEEGQEINEIELKFNNNNYNWLVNLEASNNQTEWFSILEKYRITKIKNALTDYSFNRIIFPNTLYKYYRISFKSKYKPILENANVKKIDTVKGSYRKYFVNIISNKKNKKNETIINFRIDNKTRVSKINLNIESDFDYQREFSLEYLVDSFKTEKGWKYNYRTVLNSYISSLEDNSFSFSEVKADVYQLKIINNDNLPISVSTITLEGVNYKLTARFNKNTDKYILSYGDKTLDKPIYDIVNFKDKIPANITKLSLASAKKVYIEKKETVSPMFENELWLWAILLVIIAGLGWFTYSMLKK